MAHNHNHGEGHGHHAHHSHELSSLNRAFILGIGLNIVFVLAEFGAGFWFNSLGLLSDAGHNLSDVASLVLAMLAFRLAKVHPTSKYTYGYKKSTVLVSLFNAVILLIAVGIILAESIEKFIHPQPVEGGAIAWVAGIGVLINGFTAWLFMKDKDRDLNVKGAYLHMAADALVSIGVVVSGIIIIHTGWYIIDPIIGIGIALVIIYSTWDLLKDSLRLSLDGVPTGTSLKEVEEIMQSVGGVENVHHLHIWPISTTETALTAHVVIPDLTLMERIKEQIKKQLNEAGIQHITLEFEFPNKACPDGCGPLLSKD
ncbi:cation transporter [Parabacteroides sp. 52]|uniref:cation diffusion facilitator family transporter n=1 Tax=Parabacteroides sp. 52 TaxID=2302940 RepID=UPI0013D79894|nr:cation diffusion facilitator family transporter [Parabacteroides sp. 52]NDV55799.1 cation transporter [Parabacteroides sp. 52]